MAFSRVVEVSIGSCGEEITLKEKHGAQHVTYSVTKDIEVIEEHISLLNVPCQLPHDNEPENPRRL